jgi:hypothetical protein
MHHQDVCSHKLLLMLCCLDASGIEVFYPHAHVAPRSADAPLPALPISLLIASIDRYSGGCLSST